MAILPDQRRLFKRGLWLSCAVYMGLAAMKLCNLSGTLLPRKPASIVSYGGFGLVAIHLNSLDNPKQLNPRITYSSYLQCWKKSLVDIYYPPRNIQITA